MSRRRPALADFDLVGSNHGELLTQDAPLDLVINALGGTSTQTGGGTKNLTGTAAIRLEYASIATDHDPFTTDENRFEIWLDKDGGNNSYVLVNPSGRDAITTQYVTNLTLSYDKDGQDHHQKSTADAAGGTDTLRISLNGLTSDPV